jgi:pSer/pThr/pTyr-binding forkhead associated (FHA) protein
MLSRKHCVLSDKGEELYLSDSGSLNGTRFKGVLVEEPVRLQYGDEFTLGNDLTFLVQPPIESERDTIPLKAAGQTTVVFPDATDSQLSTMATANE